MSITSTAAAIGEGVGVPITHNLAIDVSHHQGVINWGKVKPQVDFAYIKASEGINGVDERFLFNAKEAATAGVPFGLYHYATLNNEDELTDAKTEALHFIDTIIKVPHFQMPLVLDIEDDTKKVDLDDNEVLAWVNTFFQTLASKGFTNYALYSYTPFLLTRLPATHNLSAVRLWIAAYTKKPQPKIPSQWPSYWLWQYSATGTIDGIKTPVDLNKFPG